MVTPEQVKAMIEAKLSDAQVQVEDLTGTRDHYQLTVVSPDFEGIPRVRQHQLVYGALQDAMSSEAIHALTMKTYTPEAWAATSGAVS
ncbi:BolA family protein [Phormidium sp. CCY1219]|jgi:acid stress-induced BolA-like protein IbaG/YrbA|uniref:BolA family protein n=1 Tax=Phormidium sp. CCY1219 TaxID=2886104 RepID=UPI002D1F996B|nr:BolA/IbaG family iron-sulfur metabolism protein [Phormidium sp. CCY1219]MEB3830854.1 BolA/IbaG family iron-sulfur metabolism protein [Phormidium sp. CCY1219]